MHDSQQPSANRWRLIRFHGGSYRIPLPPGPPPEMSKAEREAREEQARAAERAAPAARRLASGLSVGVIVMGLALAAVIVMSMLVLISRH
jgi:hypothetical protein